MLLKLRSVAPQPAKKMSSRPASRPHELSSPRFGWVDRCRHAARLEPVRYPPVNVAQLRQTPDCASAARGPLWGRASVRLTWSSVPAGGVSRCGGLRVFGAVAQASLDFLDRALLFMPMMPWMFLVVDGWLALMGCRSIRHNNSSHCSHPRRGGMWIGYTFLRRCKSYQRYIYGENGG